MSALAGVRILDLSRLLPGPFATLVLADLGASVDKLEDPELGDYLRHTPPQVDGNSVAFHALNRGKRSLVMNLKSAAGAAAFKRLVRSYDVVFEQFRPGVLARLGLGHDVLLAENPRLVVCALTGYGQDGPLRDRAGHDVNYLARAGILGLMGPEDRPPQLPSFQLADFGGGMWSIIGILAALRERDRTGRGSVVDIAMAEGVIPFATSALSHVLGGGEMPRRGGEHLTGGIAPYYTYRTKDGEFVSFGALEPKFLQRFAAGSGMDVDVTALMPGPHQLELKERFADVFASRTRAEWQQFNEQHDCCLEPVLRPDELMSDPHLIARNVFLRSGNPTGQFHELRTPVTPRDLVPKPAPRTAEHSDEILEDAGFSAEEIARLRAEQVVA